MAKKKDLMIARVNGAAEDALNICVDYLRARLDGLDDKRARVRAFSELTTLLWELVSEAREESEQ